MTRGHGKFHLIALDEAGVQSTDNADRLVCRIDGGGKLAIWGSEISHSNIDAVLNAGMPCTVECDYQEPEDWAWKFGHTYWVPQGWELRVIK